MTVEMKPWQKGYELDYLLNIEKVFKDHYNKYCFGPFSEVKKHRIAGWLSDKSLQEITSEGKIVGYIDTKVSKVRSEIKMFQDAVIGVKEKGDRSVNKFVVIPGSEYRLVDILRGYDEPTWVTIPEEDERSKAIVETAGYKYVGTKFTGFAEIFGVYFKDCTQGVFDEPRVHPVLNPMENVNIKKAFGAPDFSKECASMSERLKELEFEAHYSNYNKGKLWGGLSLKGFSSDPTFIEKPLEMDEKWHSKNPGPHEIQSTTLREKFPEIETIISGIGLKESQIERIRLLRLKPGGGGKEIARHSDLTDYETGPMDAQVGRLHVPLITNPNVRFCSWNIHGGCDEVNMKVGELWYLDSRKPHRVINEGTEDRIHVIIDAHFDDSIRGLFFE